jgi:hypothetical protein
MLTYAAHTAGKLRSEEYGPEVQAQGEHVRRLKARRLEGAPDVTAEMIDAEVQKLVALKKAFRFRV